jgi:drug/metabolite transporter (DMT)-like permease
MFTYFVAMLCVVGIAAGQILFKMCAVAIKSSSSLLEPRVVVLFVVSLALYGATTLAWIWVLQKADLGKIYPFMALAFVIVPVGSYFVFGEKFSPQYFLGVAMIMAGIVITIRS